MSSKIRIKEIAPEVFTFRGFDRRGCFKHGCEDLCCIGGVEVDKQAYDLMCEHRDLIEGRLGRPLESCFEGEWTGDSGFHGGDSVNSAVYGEDDYCAFHEREGRGCVLYSLAAREGVNVRVVPAVCRLYPLTWADGMLHVSEHLEAMCNCLAIDNVTTNTLLVTQREPIEDLFVLDERLVPCISDGERDKV
jgi:hypothetical protein